MSDLPKCRLCGADAAVHKVFGGIKYCCSSETCTMHDVLMLKSQWRTLMTKQQPDQDRLRFKSACEISGDKHPEYVRGYEAAMDAVCRARKKQAEPVGVVREFHVDWRDKKPPEGTELYSCGSLGPSLLEQSDLEFIAARLGRVAKRVGYPMPSGDAQFIVSVSGSILGAIAYILDGDTRTASHPAPIPRNERMPALADADPFGMVAWWNSFDNFWVLKNWDSKPARPIFTHWLPTGLKMPPAPTNKEKTNAKNSD